MLQVAGNGLPISSNNSLGLRSGLFELVDAKFKRGLTDKKYTIREILNNDNCSVLLPQRDQFYKYVKSQVQCENPIFNIIQCILYIIAGLLYLPSIIFGFYKSGFITANTSLTGESHHSLILHDYAVVWGDYLIPLLITCCIAGLFPLIIIILKIRTDRKKISDLLDSVETERENTIKEHSLISCFFTLCDILHKISLISPHSYCENNQQVIKDDLISVCEQFNLKQFEFTYSPFISIEQLDINTLDANIRNLLLSDKFSEIIKVIVCKIREQINISDVNTLFISHRKELNPTFEDALESNVAKNKILNIIADICAKKMDVREEPIPQPIYLTKDLDLLGVREALVEYWGDLSSNELVIHYTLDFNHLCYKILRTFQTRYAEDFYQQEIITVRQPSLRQAPALETYYPESYPYERQQTSCPAPSLILK